MSLPTEPIILTALSSYRTHIGTQNYRASSAIIPDIKAADPEDPELFDSEEEVEELRLEFTLNIVGASHDTRPPITHPSDLLTHWDALAPQLALDGAAVDPDASWRDKMRDVYKQGVLRGLNERCTGTVTTWEFPSDLAVVLQHVDSLEGPGWYKYRDNHKTLIFFEGWVRNRGMGDLTEEIVLEQVRTAGEIIERTVGLEDEYEIAGGWVCSEKGNEATCYVVYSRPQDADREQRWSWRYVASLGQFGTHVFENIVELLEWYQSYEEIPEVDWSVSAEEVFQP
ncbi:uncharacterized protein F4812DRAFT_105414 [Daldinia caldariorum]|uniref:uncharacterized protein n=1 Tax=Daldinia caldariorum TaxID=326644 RepID=UPI00200775A4|nr:uncharacterized protein F4812DRAFT_105414 [Daldinia caldariorum]KAI1465657.1 hypothetical protein F4812DRAFT_105414 [Daldinia caldariorum]